MSGASRVIGVDLNPNRFEEGSINLVIICLRNSKIGYAPG